VEKKAGKGGDNVNMRKDTVVVLGICMHASCNCLNISYWLWNF